MREVDALNLSKGWKEVSLAEISTKIGDGLHGTPKYDDSGKYYFINGNNLGNGKIYIYPTTNRISQSEYEKIKKELNDRTILLGINGTIGNLGFYNDEKVALGKSACYINLKNDVDKHYIRYVLEFDHFQNYAQLFATGSTIRNLGLKAIRNYKFFLPPLETQRKITSILSGYDDLIENNLKRIKILEEMAQQTYEEWFVRMRFPGYETAVMNEETGLPEGWEKVKLGEKIEVGRGSSPRPIADKKYFENGTIPWLKIADATASKIYIYKTKEYVNDYGASFSRKLPIGSLILAASGTLGFPMFLGVEACIHDGWIYFKGVEDDLKECFYFSFIGLKRYFDGIAYGAAIQNINTTILRESPLIVPDIDTLKNFKIIASGALDTIVNLQQQNQRLREARDLLLPRLMMGIVEV